jgi:type I restriction enzyme M protein
MNNRIIITEKLMAKKIKEVKEKAIEVTLWEAANKLRGSVEPAEYKHVVLGLIFLKFASDKFEEHRAKLIADGKEKYIEMADFYNMSNVFFLEEISRWSYIVKKARQNDIALIIDTALHTIEKDNKSLKGALPDNYFSRLGLDITKLASLISEIDSINTLKDKEQDLVGRVYEYFLKKFAIAEGKGKGEFYTPKTIVNLIAEMIEPYKGIIYDPAHVAQVVCLFNLLNLSMHIMETKKRFLFTAKNTLKPLTNWQR